MLKEYFLEKVKSSITELVKNGQLGQMTEENEYNLQ